MPTAVPNNAHLYKHKTLPFKSPAGPLAPGSILEQFELCPPTKPEGGASPEETGCGWTPHDIGLDSSIGREEESC